MKAIQKSLKFHQNVTMHSEYFYKLQYSTSSKDLRKKIISFDPTKSQYAKQIANDIRSLDYFSPNDDLFVARIIYLLFTNNHFVDINIFLGDDCIVYFHAPNGSNMIQSVLSEFASHLNSSHSPSSLSRDLVAFDLLKASSFKEQVNLRLEEVSKFYLEDYQEQISWFYNLLSDKISQLSYNHFLFQRVEGHIKYHALAMYPITPPKQTEHWRKQRENDSSIYRPKLSGANPLLINVFLRDTFILEQYAIEGIVEAQLGDTVIDAGAFIGDTALYFSHKVGKNGRVFAFEPIPSNISAAKQNIIDNQVSNIEIEPYALSNKFEQLNFVEVVFASASHATNKNTGLSVQAITLDSFTKEKSLNIDFIKCDLEGCDVQFIEGATQTISRDAPTLGIALYHKQKDFIQIPEMIKALRDDYHFYFRCETEPCLYAITSERAQKLINSRNK